MSEAPDVPPWTEATMQPNSAYVSQLTPFRRIRTVVVRCRPTRTPEQDDEQGEQGAKNMGIFRCFAEYILEPGWEWHRGFGLVA